MATLKEIANVLNGTLQEDTQYRGQHSIQDDIATFDVSGLVLSDLATELVEGLNESEDGEAFTFTFTTDSEEREFITITKK